MTIDNQLETKSLKNQAMYSKEILKLKKKKA